MRMTDIRGYVLAGGHSSRMGSDKALLAVNHHTAIEHQCELLEPFCPQGVFIAGARSRKLHDMRWPVIQDEDQDQGPLSGVLAAMQHAKNGIALIVAVDLVALSHADIAALMDANTHNYEEQPDVFYAHSEHDPNEKGAQPLCAVWRVETSRPVLNQQFVDNQRSVMKAWLGLRRHRVVIAESHLININSPDDFANFRRTEG